MATLLLDDQPLVILPQLAVAIGLNESIVVQQLHYWLEKSENVHDGYKWVYNTYEDWREQFPFWSESTIRRIITKLEKIGIIVSANFNRSKIDKTKWYRIDYDKLAEFTQETPSNQDEQTTVQDDVSTVQNEQTTDEIVNPSVQDDQSSCSDWTVEALNLTRPIPDNTTENTSEIKTEDEEDARAHSFREIIHFIEQNGFGTVGSYIGEKITSWVDDTSEELVLEALKIAVENGAKTWKYVETILRDWFEKGYRTVGQVRAAQLAFREQQLKKRSASSSSGDGRKTRKPVRTEIVPDWLKMDYSQPEDDFDVEQARRELEERLKKYKDNPDG
ncbi:replication protein [Geobacillus sp. 46C-IIa]|uniref:DnaD domain-containing protein n=1 Tax=Geobacillus sp. 46C-IIa TaxID=1963025 RepID=UPI0009BECA89|nr:DnaD domain protein [Geobacillus sp. 46C-IIa]OQP06821.1 replication protein [Geobacillus sp. 46C-IIa]QNU27461.1 DnaD domain protein [Geobacillus sp. 46C-IIa]